MLDPAVRPSTMRRWKIRTMMTKGTVTITPAAICSPKGAWNSVAPVNLEIATVAVWTLFPECVQAGRPVDANSASFCRVANFAWLAS